MTAYVVDGLTIALATGVKVYVGYGVGVTETFATLNSNGTFGIGYTVPLKVSVDPATALAGGGGGGMNTYGLSPAELKSAMAQAQSGKTASGQQAYNKLLQQQTIQNMSESSALQPGAMTIQEQKIQQGVQDALVNQVYDIPGIGKVTAGDLSKFQLAEAGTPTKVKVAKAAMGDADLKQEMEDQSRAGAMNLGEALGKRKAIATQEQRAVYQTPKYGATVKKNVNELNKSLVRQAQRDTPEGAVAKQDLNDKYNDQYYSDFSNSYGEVMESKNKATGEMWFVYVDEQGVTQPIRRKAQ